MVAAIFWILIGLALAWAWSICKLAYGVFLMSQLQDLTDALATAKSKVDAAAVRVAGITPPDLTGAIQQANDIGTAADLIAPAPVVAPPAP